MKLIERTTLILFSILVLVLSVISCLLILGWLDVGFLSQIILAVLSNPTYSNILLGVCTVFILLAIKCIFFSSSTKPKDENQNGILLENANGKLLITKETIENLVNNVVKGFDSAEDITTKIELDKENNLRVYVNLSVKENAVIKELSTNLQTKIKTAIKKTSDLEVKEVNIKIKNVEPIKDIVQE